MLGLAIGTGFSLLSEAFIEEQRRLAQDSSSSSGSEGGYG
jgi:hypothetical protein